MGSSKEETEAAAIQELRLRVQDVLKDDHGDDFLLRWLKAQKFNVKEAENMLRQCLRIRYSFQIDKILDTFTPNDTMLKYGFLGFLGYDRTGSPIRYINIGAGDFDGYIRSFSSADIGLYSAFVLENDLRTAKIHNQELGVDKKTELLVIMDMETFVLQQVLHSHVMETGMDLMRLLQDLYTPDILRKVVIINAPVYFSAAYNIFKPILKNDLVEKLQICSSKASSHEALLQYIAPEVLPVFLGGQRVDDYSDPFCKSFIRQGGKIPEGYYKQCPFPMPNENSYYQEFYIPAGIHKDYTCEVDSPGTVMRVEVISDNSIGLSMLYKKRVVVSDSNENRSDVVKFEDEPVSPYMKLQAHLCPGYSFVHCERIGEYILRFDNSFSWWNAKNVQFRVDLTRPG